MKQHVCLFVCLFCTTFFSLFSLFVSHTSFFIYLRLGSVFLSVFRKAVKIIFGWVDYTEALVLAGLESLSDRRVGACKRFMATARQMSPLRTSSPLLPLLSFTTV